MFTDTFTSDLRVGDEILFRSQVCEVFSVSRLVNGHYALTISNDADSEEITITSEACEIWQCWAGATLVPTNDLPSFWDGDFPRQSDGFDQTPLRF